MKRRLFTKQFWYDVTERAAKTFGQAGVGVIGGTAIVTGLDWEVVGYSVGFAVAGSVLTSLASLEIGESGTASVLNAMPPPPPPA